VQQEIAIKPSRVNFVGSRRAGLLEFALLVTLGGELSYAALGFSTGSFTLTRIHLKEVFGVGLQVLQMYAVILGFCLLIVRIAGVCGLA
jgi:hypothetical protein